MKKNHFFQKNILCFVLLIPNKGWTMSIFDFAKICLFSEVKGVVQKDGKPVANAHVIQTVKKEGKEFRNTTITNTQGEFHFAPIYTHSISTVLPVEPTYTQRIFIQYEGKELRGWMLVKNDNEENTELGGRPIRLRCDVNAEDTRKEVGNQVLLGICSWE